MMTKPRVDYFRGRDGEKYVTYEDAEALAARVEELLDARQADCENIQRCVAENQRLREALEETPCNCDKTDPCWVKVCVRCSALKEKP